MDLYIDFIIDGLPIRRLSDSPIDSSSVLADDQSRTKRIYWENLAFHATDYNQKAKKPKRSK
jgi:hypothetical protein